VSSNSLSDCYCILWHFHSYIIYLFLSYIITLLCFIDYVMMNDRMIVLRKYELEKIWK